MNLLINESPLLILPSLAKQVGLNEAVILQQLHFRSLISKNHKDGHVWVYKTYEEWREEFPFWSERTIKRTMRKLEEEGYVISTSAYNRMKTDRTKWYRIDYAKCQMVSGEFVPLSGAECPDGEGQVGTNRNDNLAPQDCDKLSPPITKELKRKLKKDKSETSLDVISEIIHYLNAKTGKDFKANAKWSQQLIRERLAEGYALKDFKAVIDVKGKQWENDPRMRKYLRPSTLFSPAHFENYLNEVPAEPDWKPVAYEAVDLDFGKGEFR
ncbi:hypothetical protein OXB_2404 [Bacillus sp. OxB-1]|uniref:conserved phage C-terminal domain-containing protein n=1 Tax=Bacillus sp. (strain OxB-1) TaxID=98228 RepID=UPI00058222C1|nr:conserved phage C-terminal domain-containing protein [Bacillus sp. OxB-1]BAQ10875.1 hypothetical protein OXB_2404 [Bacillus sp. OxB-1]